MRKSLGDFFWKKCRQGMKRNQKESKRNDSRNVLDMSWTNLGHTPDAFGMPSGWVATRKSPEAEAPGQVSVIKKLPL